MEGRLEGFKVEFHAGVDHARGGVGECLQLGIVRGDQTGHALIDQVRQNSARQRRAFLRISAGTQLIQQHQRERIHAFEDTHDVRDVSGKSGERLFDRLLVADVSVDVAEQAERGAGLGRDVQAGLSHQSQ